MDWLSQFSQASRQTKYFVLTAVSLILLIIVTLVWSYAHTAYARSAVRARGAPFRAQVSERLSMDELDNLDVLD